MLPRIASQLGYFLGTVVFVLGVLLTRKTRHNMVCLEKQPLSVKTCNMKRPYLFWWQSAHTLVAIVLTRRKSLRIVHEQQSKTVSDFGWLRLETIEGLLSCLQDTLGGYALTLIDSLDMLAMMGNRTEFAWAVKVRMVWFGHIRNCFSCLKLPFYPCLCNDNTPACMPAKVPRQ